MNNHTPSDTEPMTPAFAAANRYLGWGEPEGGLWFVGLEEADGWYDKSADEIVRIYAALGEVSPATTQTDFAALGAAGRSIRHTISRISSVVSARASAIDAGERWRWYHDNMLWRVGSRGFQANLYPLGKPTRASWPAQIETLFGFGPADRDAYKAVVAASRFKRLRARWLEDAPLATICFGMEAWADFRDIFGVTSAPRELARGRVHVHDRERVVLTRFFSYGHVTNADADAIGRLLRDEWNVRVP